MDYTAKFVDNSYYFFTEDPTFPNIHLYKKEIWNEKDKTINPMFICYSVIQAQVENSKVDIKELLNIFYRLKKQNYFCDFLKTEHIIYVTEDDFVQVYTLSLNSTTFLLKRIAKNYCKVMLVVNDIIEKIHIYVNPSKSWIKELDIKKFSKGRSVRSVDYKVTYYVTKNWLMRYELDKEEIAFLTILGLY
jgi:hypothetical protein